LGKML